MSIVIPKSLKMGDTVALISASGATPTERLQPAIEAVEKLGFRVVVGETCRTRHGYFGGDDALRAKEVNEMFANAEIDGIFCIRGGYGATRILPMLDLELISNNPKVFAGYSDVTALHTVFNQICGFVTYHTPMPSTEFIKENMDEYTWEYFIKSVTNTNWSDYLLENAKDDPLETLVSGAATGQLVGGNLTLVTASLGTPFEIDLKGKILFLEDIDENVQRIDRMLTQLSTSGKLNELAGILLGGWTDCGPMDAKNPENNLDLITVFEEILAPLNIPILMNVTCGHMLPTMSLPLGKTITMDATNKTIRVVG
ncbi:MULTISPECIES: S66 peptidase family protein [Solibacillus]|uniref:LD-carboxypeptidase n=1 Tax=Solibacillus merdavium TaxID=2762218 RepID=A0ABR8XRB7_9BACL|nr:LD-carboxypeptidase [Solibacillus merdavium]MBD8034478.1 LD-carboxypeptidase [Solibacillus merdavium]